MCPSIELGIGVSGPQGVPGATGPQGLPGALGPDETHTAYVRSDGNDATADGTQSHPFLTVAAAVAYVVANRVGSDRWVIDIGSMTAAENVVSGDYLTFRGLSRYRSFVNQITCATDTIIENLNVGVVLQFGAGGSHIMRDCDFGDMTVSENNDAILVERCTSTGVVTVPTYYAYFRAYYCQLNSLITYGNTLLSHCHESDMTVHSGASVKVRANTCNSLNNPDSISINGTVDA